MSPSKILFFICISIVLGIFFESVVKVPPFFVWAFLFAGVLLVLLSILTKKYLGIIGFCVLFLVLGILRVQISEFNIANDALIKLNGAGKTTLIGIIADEPDLRENSQQIKVKIDKSTILVTTGKYPEYHYLDNIQITGKLETPIVFDDFNYKDYLLKDHIYSVMYFPKIQVTSTEHSHNLFSYVYEKILFLKQGMRQSIEENFAPMQNSILQSMILGDNGAMSQDVKDKLSSTGLRHFIAIDGLHIVILISIVMSFLLACGMWRTRAFYVTAIFISGYIILTGASAASLRAGIMGLVYLLAQKIGRQTMSVRIIALAGTLMLLANPLLLYYDVGFQLSFLAVLGLIYFEPLIRNFLKFMLSKFLKIKMKEGKENVLSMFSVTIAAQVFTLPITIFNFGVVSYFSIFANLLVLPVIYFILLFGFLSSLLGVVWSVLGRLVSIPCYFLMAYFIWVMNFFSQSWMAKTVSNVSWIWVWVSYIILAVITWRLTKMAEKNVPV